VTLVKMSRSSSQLAKTPHSIVALHAILMEIERYAYRLPLDATSQHLRKVGNDLTLQLKWLPLCHRGGIELLL